MNPDTQTPRVENLIRELEEFIAEQPPWVQKHLRDNPYSPFVLYNADDLQAIASVENSTSGPSEVLRSAIQGVQDRISRIPRRDRKRLLRRVSQDILRTTPLMQPGRPRQDAEAHETLKLKASGKTWGEIAKAHGKSKDAVRKLAKSRTRTPTGKNPR